MTSDPIFVPGKPLTDIWAAPGLRWSAQLAAAIPGALRHPRLRFVRNDHNHFDLDNLAYPVLAVAGCAACESVWASITQGATEGVSITEEVPPSPPASSVAIRIERPNTASIADRPPPSELTAVEVVAPGRRLGLSLEFDAADVAVGELSYEGPTKSLIDDPARAPGLPTLPRTSGVRRREDQGAADHPWPPSGWARSPRGALAA